MGEIMSRVWSQGDITIRAIDDTRAVDVEELRKAPITELKLSGETGKTHSLIGRVITHQPGWHNPAQTSYVLLEKPTSIEHPEHGKMQLDSGLYEVTRQREWTGGRIGIGGD